MATSRRSPTINVMAKAALKAARSLLHDFGEVENLQVSRKGPGDFVSQADFRAEKIIREELERARPEYGFLLEEGGEVAGDGQHRWLVDPLDGTNNFLHGIPHWAISIGLERDKEVIAGVVYDPIRDELFWAERGVGAYVADRRALDRRLRVASRVKLTDCLLATGLNPGSALAPDKRARFLAEFDKVSDAGATIRRFGSAAIDLAYTAAGRFDGFWEGTISPWDMAAGIVLVREAGGMVSDVAGGPDPIGKLSILAGNDNVHNALRKVLKTAG